MSDPKNVKFSLKAMVNKEKTKVLFVEARGDFVDVLLSFLTMPLGKLVKVLEKHFGVDESPAIGSITTLYKGFTNLHSDNFCTVAGKEMLLNPMSSFEAECRGLKLDITDTQLPTSVICNCCKTTTCFVSMYYDAHCCSRCMMPTTKAIPENEFCGIGVFIKRMAPFIISDDLRIFPQVKELKQAIDILGITDHIDAAGLMNVTFGVNEIMGLLKASLCSPTPLSDVILNQTSQMSPPPIVRSEHGSTLSYQMKMDANSNFKKIILKVIVQKSSNKILCGQAGEDFIDFLCSFLTIPLGRIVELLGSGNCFKSINNLYKSVADVTDYKFFQYPGLKDRFTCMKLANGSISENQILPLTEEEVSEPSNFSHSNFPEGPGKYVNGIQTYVVADDLTVTPFYISSTIAMLNKLNIPLSDIKEVEQQIGEQEALSILRASLSSTFVLTDALNINPTSEKKPKHGKA